MIVELQLAWTVNDFAVSVQGLFREWWASESTPDLPYEHSREFKS